jgi:hypothetical protein
MARWLFLCVHVFAIYTLLSDAFLTSNIPIHSRHKSLVLARSFRRTSTHEKLHFSMESLVVDPREVKTDMSNLKLEAPEVNFEHGRYKPFGKYGEITNDCASEKIPDNWQSLISEAFRAYGDAASKSGLTLAAVYIGGSVPRGLALDGRSDLCMFGYFIPPPGIRPPLPKRWRHLPRCSRAYELKLIRNGDLAHDC